MHMTNRLCEDGIRMRHPDYSDRQVFLARARLNLGETLYRDVYPSEPVLAP